MSSSAKEPTTSKCELFWPNLSLVDQAANSDVLVIAKAGKPFGDGKRYQANF